MKNEKPILLFAFANDSDRPLSNLAEEERAARDALAVAHDQHRIEFHTIGHTNLNDIYRAFNRFHNRVAIFHYGGHSDENFLNLEDTNSRAGSLSKLIGMQRKLQLVFLNGCGNREQVKLLFDQGVKAVIATDTSIDDNRARAFSSQFYAAMAAGKCIEDAFNTAAAYVQNDDPDLEIVNRGIRFRDEDKGHIPWGLYTQNDDVLKWTLPPPLEVPADLDYFQEVPIGHLEINRQLVLLTFEGMAEYSTEHEKMYELYKQMPSASMFNMLQNAMLDSFPSILSTQIRDLFTPEGRSRGRLRLQEIREAYETMVRLLCSIALSNLWDIALEVQAIDSEQRLLIREEYLQELRDFLNMSPEESHNFDYLWMVATISRIMMDNQVEPYVKELAYLNQSFREAMEYYEAYTFMEQHVRRPLLAGNIPSREVEELCLEAEHHLGRMLQKCAFLCNYQMVTVKNISVYLPRPFPKPKFIHAKAVLRGRDYLTIDREPVSRDSYLSNNAVVITSDIQDEKPPLNLSPFIIDENAFKVVEDFLPKIYFFSGQPGDRDKLCFHHAEMTEEEFCVEKDNYDTRKYQDLEVLFEQIDFFREIIGLKKYN